MYADESLYGRVCVSRCVFLQLQPTSPHAAINAAVSPPLSLSLPLSLIYIAMTPVSVMLAPCCEFHLSRKTSGDCYANGYVVGLVQEEKNGNVCILMWVLGGSKRGGKRQDTEREEKERGMKKE